jgi:hypothetical protein
MAVRAAIRRRRFANVRKEMRSLRKSPQVPTVKPRYLPHLVEGYVFLGQYTEFDLYFRDMGQSATLIGRYGHGPLNKAFNLTLLGLPEPDNAPEWLLEAYSRAKQRDLIGERDQ